MRQLYLTLGVLVLLGSWSSPAAAQVPAQGPTEGLSPPSTNPAILPPSGPGPAADPFGKTWTVDAVLGAPTAVRVQHNLGDGVGKDWLVEGLAGVELIFPTIGVGIRRAFTPLCGDRDALRINPGVDAYLLGNVWSWGHNWYSCGPATIELFTVDVDILWDHAFGDQCAGQLGLKLGGGIGYGNRWGGVPVVGIILGCRF